MLVNQTEMESTEETYNEIDRMSTESTVYVQYPDGALWSVNDKKWRKLNAA